LAGLSLVRTEEVHGDVFPIVGPVWLGEVVEQGRVSDLGFAQPLEEVEIQDVPVTLSNVRTPVYRSRERLTIQAPQDFSKSCARRPTCNKLAQAHAYWPTHSWPSKS